MLKYLSIPLLIVILLFSSCKSTYNFCQIYETKPFNDNDIKSSKNGIQFENEQCIISYNFWSDHGHAGFLFYNKTDEIIYVDLTKSFFTRNGNVYDLFDGKEWTSSSSYSISDSYQWTTSSFASLSTIEKVITGIMIPITYGGEVVSVTGTVGKSKSQSTTSGTSTTRSSSVTTKEKPIIAIPPHKSKYISTYNIAVSRFLSCELEILPQKSSRVTFTKENSPLQFSNFITYSVGENGSVISIENAFYVSAVTNYAEPEIVEYREREAPCKNLKNESEYANETEYGEQLYDKFTKANVCVFASSFYWMYSTESFEHIYDKKEANYSYSSNYGAYKKHNK